MPLYHDTLEGFARSRRRRDVFLIVAAGVAAGGVLFVFEPGASRLYPPCLFHHITGLYCPGCGTLRALAALLHGRIVAAFGYNPLMVAFLPYLALEFACYGLGLSGTKRVGAPWRKWLTPRLAFAVIVVYWIVRNIPAWPLTRLAP